MMFRTCMYDIEVRQALKDGHWPAGCAPELREHVESCADCRDLVLVTEAFQLARTHSAHEGPEISGLLWWRAQLQRRRTAAEQVNRPLTVAQVFAWVVSLFMGIAFAVSQYHHGLQWSSWWSEFAPSRIFRLSSITTINLDWNPILLVSTLGVMALLAGLVVYLVSERS